MELRCYLFMMALEYKSTLWIQKKHLGYAPGRVYCLSRESNLGKFQVATQHLGGFYYIPFYVHPSVSGVDTVYIILYVYTRLLSLKINLASSPCRCPVSNSSSTSQLAPESLSPEIGTCRSTGHSTYAEAAVPPV